MGTTRGATRFLQVFDVDDVIFGWVEDLPPQGGAVFVEWVWDVEYVEGLGWVADDATV